MGAPVVHWEINTSNAARLHEFYATLFGWEVNANNPMNYGLVTTGNKRGIGGGIGQNDPNMPPPPPVTFYVAVDDMQETLNRAVSMGGTIVLPITEIPNMVTFALFRDPEGNTVGIVKDEPQPKQVARKKSSTRKATAKPKAKAKAKAKKFRARRR